MRVYRGYPQRGAGLGNILGALFRAAKPILRSMIPVAANFGSRVLGDVAQGKNVLRSAKRHAPSAGMDALRTVIKRTGTKQRGRGLNTSRVKKRRKDTHIKSSGAKRKRQTRTLAKRLKDVFD